MKRPEKFEASVLHRAGDAWTDLQPQIVHETGHDRAVLWVSWSRTSLVFANLDGLLTRTRQPAHLSEHVGDGWPLLIEYPFFATACGCGDATGYRSTPPVLVASIDEPADVTPFVQDAMERARRLSATGFDLDEVPAGHPPKPCGAMFYPRIRPDAVSG